jgi:hypothetical protein
MNHAKSKDSLRPIESVSVIQMTRTVSTEADEVVLSSPRANLAYSFLRSWQWLKRVFKKREI